MYKIKKERKNIKLNKLNELIVKMDSEMKGESTSNFNTTGKKDIDKESFSKLRKSTLESVQKSKKDLDLMKTNYISQ